MKPSVRVAGSVFFCFVLPALLVAVAAGVHRHLNDWQADYKVRMVVGVDMDHKASLHFVKACKEAGMSDRVIAQAIQDRAIADIEQRCRDFCSKNFSVGALRNGRIEVLARSQQDLDRGMNICIHRCGLCIHILAGQEETRDAFVAIDEYFAETPEKRFLPLLHKAIIGPSLEVRAADIDRVRALVMDADSVPGVIPEEKMIAFGEEIEHPNVYRVYPIYLMNKRAELVNPEILNVIARRAREGSGYCVEVTFGLSRAREFEEMAEAHIGKRLAFVIDDVVLAAATIKSEISGPVVIGRDLSKEEAEKLVSTLLASTGSVAPIYEVSRTIREPRSP